MLLTSNLQSQAALNGWIILDKPVGITCTKAGSLVKRWLGVKKIGHAGTLDPFASGVLPLAIGEATKTMPYVVGTKKTYQFQIRWGAQTDTLDSTGKVITQCSLRPSEQQIQSVLPRFIGSIEQTPPIYSALRVKGERAYNLARQGCSFQLAARKIMIEKLILLSIDNTHQATFEVTCGAGTYVRSLGQDIAHALETVGHLTSLRRTKVGKFTEDAIISLENLQEIGHNSSSDSVLLSIGAVLDDIPAVPVPQDSKKRIYQGQPISVSPLNGKEETVAIWFEDQVIAIGLYRDGLIYPKRVFNYT